MEEKTTLFAYVYWSIQQDIVAGVLPHGSALPSLRQLAARYHVGMRTARDVMAALREDGYIETHERRRATVRYGDGASEEAAQAAAALLARRATIEQSLDTMALVMPAAFAACAAGRLRGGRDSFRLDGGGRRTSADDLGASSMVLHEVLEAAGNATLSACYARLERAAVLPQVRGFAHPHEEARRAGRGLYAGAVAALSAGDEELTRTRFEALYADAVERAARYFDAVAAAFPEIETLPPAFEWNAKAGRVYAHAEVARDLVASIATGALAPGSFLPSIDELSTRYAVSPITVRRALGMLRDLGVAETINGRGTRVASSTLRFEGGAGGENAFRAGIEVFLDALELLVEVLPLAARQAFGALAAAPEAGDAAGRAGGDGEDWSLPGDLMRALAAAQPLQPFRVILEELEELLHWGYVFLLARPGSDARRQLMACARRAAHALADGDERAYADALAAYYRTMLVEIRGYLAQTGISA